MYTCNEHTYDCLCNLNYIMSAHVHNNGMYGTNYHTLYNKTIQSCNEKVTFTQKHVCIRAQRYQNLFIGISNKHFITIYQYM